MLPGARGRVGWGASTGVAAVVDACVVATDAVTEPGRCLSPWGALALDQITRQNDKKIEHLAHVRH